MNITEKDTSFIPGECFCPLREPGVYVPQDKEISALSLFELFFDDKSVNRIVRSTLSYAESRKDEKKHRYALFMRKPFTKEGVRAFLGCLILLGYTTFAIIKRRGVSQERNTLFVCKN